MSSRGVDFLEVWLDQNVPFTGQENDVVMAGKLASRLASDAARAGLTFADLNFGPYSPATLIMNLLVTPRIEQVTIPKSGQPFFPV